MFKTLLKNQHITFVSDVEQAEKYSPNRMKKNEEKNTYFIKHEERGIRAAGLDKEEAEAAVMFYANEHIAKELQKSA